MTYSPSAPVINFKLVADHELELVALVDSGADATMIPINFLREINAPYVKRQRMRGVTGVAQQVNLYLVTIQISVHRLPAIRVIATTPGNEVILGRDVLNHLIVMLNGLAGVTEIEI
ncbi:MAG: retroviral-like aspartic protease family protein [Chloroflexi bacterium]|nr:retroviral-like aspartic protease family protein [Chloroflexota bacterium]